jgi:O-antigen/teichoic acid export membrane protein
MKLSHMIGKLVGVVGSRFLGAALGFASQFVLARLLPVEDVGVVFLAMSAAAFISLALIGGYAMLALTQVPRLIELGKPGLLNRFHQSALWDAGVMFLLSIMVVVMAVWAGRLSHGQNLALIFGLLSAPISGLLRYNSVVANSVRRFELSYVPDFLVRPVLLLAGLLVPWALGVPFGLVSVLMLFVGIVYVVGFGQAAMLGPKNLLASGIAKPRKRFASALRGRVLSLTIVSAVALAFADIVTLTAGLILPERDVAIVGVAVRLAAIAGFVLQAGQQFILPDLTQALVRRDDGLANSLLMKINLTTLAVVAAALLGSIVLGHYVLSFFGPDYIAGATLLVLFIVGQAVRGLGGMNQHLLSLDGKQLRTAGACLLALVIFVSLSILLCRTQGFVGMGYAVIISETAWQLALAAQAQKLTGRRGDLLWLARNPVS